MIKFLGCGTAKSGTVSLTKLIEHCQNWSCTHEMHPEEEWDESADKLLEKIGMLEKFDGNGGDVACWHLPHIDAVLQKYPNIKVVCMKRDRDETVKSFIANFPQIALDGVQMFRYFPAQSGNSFERKVKNYWDMYYEIADELEEKYHNFKIFDIENLNTRKGQDKIFDFIGIQKHLRFYPTNCKYNVTKKV